MGLLPAKALEGARSVGAVVTLLISAHHAASDRIKLAKITR
jgi:hypothetical protein